MLPQHSDSEQQPRLADRLLAARRRNFIGRQPELALFRSALAGGASPFAVLYLHGPGGAGKTTLLAECARIAAESAVPVARLDGRDLDPSPPGFLRALGLALGLDAGTAPLASLAPAPRSALLVDAYEALAPLDTWLREAFLPQLPNGVLIVLAGRTPPGTGWLGDPGWADLVRVVPLRNLRPEESRAYLIARGVPDIHHPAALAFTHGLSWPRSTSGRLGRCHRAVWRYCSRGAVAATRFRSYTLLCPAMRTAREGDAAHACPPVAPPSGGIASCFAGTGGGNLGPRPRRTARPSRPRRSP